MIALAARGNRIVEVDSGAPVRLRGINRSGFEYRRDLTIGEAEWDTIAGEWGANVVRLPFNQEWALGGGAYLGAIDAAVERCAARGVYVLLDLQWIDAESRIAPLPDSGSVKVWRQMARRYGGNPAVLYDVYSEPHDVSAAQWQPWAAALVEAIRDVHPGALAFVSGVDWGYDLRGLRIDGVVYSTHVYRAKQLVWDRAFGDLAATQPVFAGEWGGGGEDLDWGRELAAYFDERGMGWTAWGWPDDPPLIDAAGQATLFGGLVRSCLRG